MNTPRAKLGDVVVVNLHGTIGQEAVFTARFNNEWRYNERQKGGDYFYSIFRDDDILQNLTTGKNYIKE